MIEIYRPSQTRALKPCKQCNKKDFNRKETITLIPNKGTEYKWNFHNECFVEFRQQLNKVSIFTVEERGG